MWRWVFRAVLCLALLPVLLSVLYSFLPPVSALMLGRMLSGQPVWRDYKPLEEISVYLQRSVVVSEDSLFCQHNGVDWQALRGQVDKVVEGGKARGASTLTMQLAKNLFLWNDRSYLRKGLEVPLAVMLDAVLTKRRILELYLNIAEWGPGVFGAEAAAQTYFGSTAAKLGPAKASLLATALPNPIARNPAQPTTGHRRLAGINQQRMRIAGGVLACVDKP
nr:monofunctional biosynthetic peptidoglycan transglycosylase [Pseudovibrio hongkongensis]